MKANSYDILLNRITKILRQNVFLKQLNLSNAIGIDRTTYGRIEREKLFFSAGQFKLLCKELGTDHLLILLLLDAILESGELSHQEILNRIKNKLESLNSFSKEQVLHYITLMLSGMDRF
jgi:transcriptional regulator with XRE-family HTH domain